MYENDKELSQMLESAALRDETPPDRVQAVHEQALRIAATGGARRVTLRKTAIAAALVASITAVGLATTQAGRDLVRSLFTEIEPTHVISGERGDDNSGWSVSRSGPGAEPFSAAEAEQIRANMDEIAALRLVGEGRLVGLLEVPETPYRPGAESVNTIYDIEYTLASGEKTTVGESLPSPAQSARMQVDEIMKLRNAGEGEIVSKTDFRLGLGKYVIRFTLADGQTVDLETIFPPGPRAERGAIFAEIQQLKQGHRFAVLDAHRAPGEPVWGVLRYILADGRVVGVVDRVPADLVSADGKYIVMPQTQEATEIEDQSGP